MGFSTTKKKAVKKDSRTYFKSKQGITQAKNMSVHVSSPVVSNDDEGYDYFSQRPTYGVNYLHDSVPGVHAERSERQLRSSYIVDEDGGVIKVD